MNFCLYFYLSSVPFIFLLLFLPLSPVYNAKEYEGIRCDFGFFYLLGCLFVCCHINMKSKDWEEEEEDELVMKRKK